MSSEPIATPASSFSQGSAEHPTPRAYRVLLVEDSPLDAGLVQQILAHDAGHAFEVECVERLSAAEERLQQGGIDIVILDLQLPDSRGIETLSRFRVAAPHIPVVVLTGFLGEEHAYSILQEGAQDFLLKTALDDSSLVRSLRYALGRHNLQISELHDRYEEQLRAFEGLPLSIAAADVSLYERQLRLIRQAQSDESSWDLLTKTKSLAVRNHELFNNLVARYRDIVVWAPECGSNAAHHHKITAAVHELVDELTQQKATVRDVIDIHSKALAQLRSGAPLEHRRAALEESLIILIELLGCLVSFYRQFAPE